MEKVKLLQLYFSAMAAVSDISGGREGCLTAF